MCMLQIGRVPLREQINNLEESRRYIVNAMGEKNAKKFLMKAMFSITIGSNDVINYFQPSIPFLSYEKVSPTIFQDFLVSNLTMNLQVQLLVHFLYLLPLFHLKC